jgi:hypothetical protein
MGNIEQPTVRCELSLEGLPLAVYREIAAHLQQVEGVEVGLTPQLSQAFDYAQSQVGSLRIHYTDLANDTSRLRVQQILDYYSDRFGVWTVIN